MLQRAQSYVTWGEATKETIALMLKKRGKIIGGKPLTEEAAQKLGYKSIDDLTEAIYNCKVGQWKCRRYANPIQTPPTKERLQRQNQEELQTQAAKQATAAKPSTN